MAVAGLMVGSLLGGRLIVYGRRRATLLTQCLAVIGSLCTCFKNLPLICFGRFALGCVGSCSTLIMGKSICETLPTHKIASYGMLTNIFINCGFAFCFALGLLIPTDPADFADDEMWKLVSAMPAFFGLININLWSLFFIEEPIAFSISANRDKDAMMHL